MCVFLVFFFFYCFLLFLFVSLDCFLKREGKKKKVWSWLSGDLGKAGKGETTQDMLYEKIFSIKNV